MITPSSLFLGQGNSILEVMKHPDLETVTLPFACILIFGETKVLGLHWGGFVEKKRKNLFMEIEFEEKELLYSEQRKLSILTRIPLRRSDRRAEKSLEDLIGTPGTLPIWLERILEELKIRVRIETIQIIVLLISPRSNMIIMMIWSTVNYSSLVWFGFMAYQPL